jgi:proline iminopeptidase
VTDPSSLYPEVTPRSSGRLKVSPLHELYYEECGNPQGKPAVLLHGGPGGGINSFMRRFHDPKAYRIILFDQRGCGQSTPHAELAENTTWDLVGDIERLRKHLNIERWQVFGGSWGSSLALAYAQTYPECVSELILRGVFLLRRAELRWFYQEGASWLFPDAWEDYLAPIPAAERDDLISAYYRRLTGTDRAAQLACARAWSQWEARTISLLPDPVRVSQFGEDRFALAFARIECHYFKHGGFLESDDQLLAQATKLVGIPGAIVHGRYDVATPLANAWELHKIWRDADFTIAPDAGHTAVEPAIAKALVAATNKFCALGINKISRPTA